MVKTSRYDWLAPIDGPYSAPICVFLHNVPSDLEGNHLADFHGI